MLGEIVENCDRCGRSGQPYTYQGRRFSGLCPNRGQKLCPSCLEGEVRDELNEPVGWAQVPAHEYVTPRSGVAR